MKGIVFAEFLEMVEEKFGLAMADQILETSSLSSGGSYTAVGTYDHQELVQLVQKLSQLSQIAIPELLHTFGYHLFGRFTLLYPSFFEGIDSAFHFLKNVHDYVHVEVRKLYPDAELPDFECDQPSAEHLNMIYRSERGLSDFAEGLIRGCIDYFKETIDLSKEDLSQGKGTVVRFVLKTQSA